MKIIVVRHGLTDANKNGIINGRLLDDNLTSEGKQQAVDLANRLSRLEIDRIFSSPLKRAIETALPIAEKLNLNIDIDARLNEVNFGSLTGKKYDDIKNILGDTASNLLSSYEYNFEPFGGESYQIVEQRVNSFLEDLKEKPYKSVLIVTHGGIVRWIHYLCTKERTSLSKNGIESILDL